MQPFTKTTILPYLQKNVFKHLDFIKKGELNDFKIAASGLVSQVYRIVVDGTPFYIKQAIPGAQKYLKILKAPADFNFIFNDKRQLAEAKALRIFEQAVGCGIAPHIYYHDTKNMIMVISAVGGQKAKLFEDTISQEISLFASEKLAEIAAKLVNNTYGKIKPLRSISADKKIKYTKLKYQCLEVYNNLDHHLKNFVKKAQLKLVEESMKIDKVLVHGDYHPRNILVNNLRVATVDLEEAHLGDPAFDIGILLGSYLLRAEYHKKIRKKAIKSVLNMTKIFFDKVNIPEDKHKLEERIKKHAGGLMLCRIDGISSRWTQWIKRESAKKSIRTHASSLILDEKNSLYDLIKQIYY